MNSPWKNVLKEPPADGTRCLVWYHSQQEIFTYNATYQVWDDSEGDDYCCSLEANPIYAELPADPTLDEIKELTNDD